jgi:hypothetical protein
LNGSDSALAQPRRTGKSAIRKVNVLIRELSDDDDDDENMESNPVPSTTPWRKEFNGYLYSKDQLGDMSIVEWWGVRKVLSMLLIYCADNLKVEC